MQEHPFSFAYAKPTVFTQFKRFFLKQPSTHQHVSTCMVQRVVSRSTSPRFPPVSRFTSSSARTMRCSTRAFSSLEAALGRLGWCLVGLVGGMVEAEWICLKI